ncbi:Bug family tripartite tricarboxylate transporter substrate binding protein [Enterovirga rhinocerotis]|uniref:Tripartite-type tricarboxylate transporter receptor subunit TctC n=1 Tax=Enterovirga rhinocerotis TaxID=1339210 RepID=A0A4R7CCQ2_9HYPH|nr:tripartite tricarboxylate transporter substrate binding protein [Enterovirga rhinocerotis]TDR94597.1 tripartite-type tricarboxylate transporter receptor subunit TctC [Enterovirga rhinocerotis]
MVRFTRRVAACLMLLALPAIGSAHAQDAYPSRPLKIIVPFAAGGPTDLVARVLGEAMSQDLKQPVVVENRPGANGNVATEAVARSDPDGYTLLYNSSHVAISPAIYAKLSFDPRKDLAPVSLTAMLPLVVVANPQLPIRTMKDFVEYAKARPGQISYGSGGVGNVTHLAMALILKLNGLEAVHVPFRGTAPALAAVASGHIQVSTDAVNSAQGLTNGGQVRGLAVLSDKRSPVTPDVPTMEEAGLGKLEIGAWQGMMVAGGTPKPIVERLHASVVKALADPGVKEKLAVQGATILATSPEDYARYLDAEIIRWTEVARDAGIKAQ